MEKKTLWAVVISFLLFFGWQKLYLEPQASAPNTVSQDQLSQTQAGSETTQISNEALDQIKTKKQRVLKNAAQLKPKESVQTVSLKIQNANVTLGNGPHLLRDWQLDGYRRSKKANAPKVDLETLVHKTSSLQFAFDREDLGYLTTASGNLVHSEEGKAVWQFEDENVELKRIVTYREDSPFLNVTFEGRFKTRPASHAFVFLSAQAIDSDEDLIDRHLIYWTKDEIQWVSLDGAVEFESISSPVRWIGSTNRYFTAAIVNQDRSIPSRGLIQPVSSGGGRISMIYPLSGERFSIPTRVYFGPKDLDILRKIEPTLDHTVDFGWFTFLAYPILRLMKWLYDYFHNFGIAIILMTLLLKIVTFPLNYKSMKSMKQMAALKPQIDRIQKKHKDNPEAKNREMMMLMKNQGYNPLAGCLPILVQMPVFFALYRVLYSSVELYQAPFILWINDLSVRDPYFVTPILLTVTMFLQQKLTPNAATDPMQQKIMQWMPIFFGAIMVTLPSGLTLYMLVNALASIIQQLVLNKKLDAGSPSVVRTSRA